MTCYCPPADFVPVLITETKNITYGTGQTTGSPLTLKCDAYIPTGAGPFSPVMLIHGGGFQSGKRTDSDIVKMARDLASKGYACFAISYRISTDNPVNELLTQAQATAIVNAYGGDDQLYGAIHATEDAAKARNFLSTSASRTAYKLNTKPWTILGQSAGAITALLLGYAGEDWWQPSAGISSNIGAIVSYWGQIPPSLLQAHGPPILHIHGTDDELILYVTSTEMVKQAARLGIWLKRISLYGVVHGHDSAKIYETPYRGGVVADEMVRFITRFIGR